VKLFQDLKEWRQHRQNLGPEPGLGFVPTMGALHAGHLSLVECCRQQNELTAVSIFVNPTQFDDPRDLDAYPQPLQQDLDMLQQFDFVIAPPASQMYPNGYRYRVSESEASTILCGAHRPGHFDGMLTVVLKLLQLVAPQRVYLGEKDFQQLELIRGMVDEFYLPIEVVACPTVRDSDGLALSSRNARLRPEERAQASQFSRLLQSPQSPETIRHQLEQAGFEVDYIQDWRGRRLGAVRLGPVRLIDNVVRERP
jgi:pantoate--beta-alanine ligase